jgi:hypothetical protein
VAACLWARRRRARLLLRCSGNRDRQHSSRYREREQSHKPRLTDCVRRRGVANISDLASWAPGPLLSV